MSKISTGYLYFLTAGIITLLALCFYTQTQATNYAQTARGADVYVLSDTQKLTVGQPTTIDILVTNDTTPLNAMEAELFFNPTLFAVSDVAFHTELCEERFIIDNLIDNTLGRIHISCGTVTPFTGSATLFGTVTLTPLQAGIGKIEFGGKTHVYIHDGLGTQIARDTYDQTFLISEV